MKALSHLKVLFLLAVIVVSLVYLYVQFRPNRSPTPIDTYRCENGHTWTEKVSPTPTCPECRAAGASDSPYRCPECTNTFVGVTVRREGVGRFSYRYPGEEDWRPAPPEHMTCPHCKHTAESRFFPGLGYGDDPPGDISEIIE